jgi:hypothetical protein
VKRYPIRRIGGDLLRASTTPTVAEETARDFGSAGFECENCGTKDVMLHVDHAYYKTGLKPWEYPDDSLRCLCKDCHREAHVSRDRFNEVLAKVDLSQAYGYALALFADNNPDEAVELHSYETAASMADYFGLTPETVIDSLQDGKTTATRLYRLAWDTGGPAGPRPWKFGRTPPAVG